MPLVKFVKEKKEIDVPEGAVLRTEAIKAGVPLNCGINGFGDSFVRAVGNCHGLGMCGTCRVLITKGIENTNKMTMREKVRFKSPIPIPDPLPCLAYIGHEDTMRLACMTKVFGDIEVESCPELNLFGESFFS